MGEDDRIDPVKMAPEGLEALATPSIPHLNSGIMRRRRGEELRIMGESD
jgi:hypothetical protein